MRMFIIAISFVIAGACGQNISELAARKSVTKDGRPASYSVEEISSRVNNLNGELVSVRGYMTGFGPIMALVEGEYSNPFSDPVLLVSDIELSIEIQSGVQHKDLKRYFDSQGCTERYVEIVGDIGMISEQQINGIVSIKSVRTFSDANFDEAGNFCFAVE